MILQGAVLRGKIVADVKLSATMSKCGSLTGAVAMHVAIPPEYGRITYNQDRIITVT